jgi:hypothetical protein
MKKESTTKVETKVGQPVQVFTPINETSFDVHPGLISSLDSGKDTQIRVFPNDGSDPILLKNVRHFDFKKNGEPFWRHLDEEAVQLRGKGKVFIKWWQ